MSVVKNEKQEAFTMSIAEFAPILKKNDLCAAKVSEMMS